MTDPSARAPGRTARATTRAATAMISTIDPDATAAGLAILRRGGSAVDAAIAANAVLTVTLPNQCGLGGDLFALVQRAGRPPEVVTAAGRAGSGADASALRDGGATRMPPDRDVRSTTVPGCVDGWLALHGRYGRLGLDEVLADAIRLARDGFTISPFVAASLRKRPDAPIESAALVTGLHGGETVRRPGAARTLAALADHGRAGVFGGELGEALLKLGAGEFTEADLTVDQAEWTAPVSLDVWGSRLWTPAPPSSGYLTLAAAWIAERAGLDADPDSPRWAHVLVEAMRQAAFDRPTMLFDGADGAALVSPARLAPRAAAIAPDTTATLTDSYRPGGTTYLCVVDADGTAVSLIQSNCMSYGSGLVIGETGIWLHNRGIGFNLTPGDPGAYAPGARPPHTLSPALVTDADNGFELALGSRGGDSQPQIVLQLLARLLLGDADPTAVLAAGRWTLRGQNDESSFDTWGFGGRVRIAVEGQAAAAWAGGLRERGHTVEVEPSYAHSFGHAQLIRRTVGGELIGAADPRIAISAAAGY